MGVSYLLLKQYDEALAGFYQAIERAPNFTPPYLHLAWALVELGQLDDANEAIKSLLEIAPKYTLNQAAKIFVYRIDEVRDRLLDSLRKAGMPED